MTELRRATWAEFAAFMSSRCDWTTSEGDAIMRTAPTLRSKRDAQIAYAAAYGYGDDDFERDVATWFSALRDQGVEPPADPPSVAEALESAAVALEKRAESLMVAADSNELDYVYAAGSRAHAAGLNEAVTALRANAKEFA